MPVFKLINFSRRGPGLCISSYNIIHGGEPYDSCIRTQMQISIKTTNITRTISISWLNYIDFGDISLLISPDYSIYRIIRTPCHFALRVMGIYDQWCVIIAALRLIHNARIRYLYATRLLINSSSPGQDGRQFGKRHFQMYFLEMKIYEFWLIFHWNLFPRVELTISQHWFR